MIAWAKNVGHNINLEDWEKVWKQNYKITKLVVYKENQYKICYQWYLAPSRLADMYPNVNPTCWKCKQARGTFFHAWWLCPKSKKYWKKIRLWIKEITSIQLEFKPEIFLLGMLKGDYANEMKYLILHIITAARIAVTMLEGRTNANK
uniref:Reverse transcriptase zinc-binding domain-containing protein n=1 Tax=Micrurus surinamensis TaxID=129470 RepID=A0A2D4PTF2_MICSU